MFKPKFESWKGVLILVRCEYVGIFLGPLG